MLENYDKKIFAQNLTYFMRDKHVNTVDVAKHLGVSKSIVSDWCNAKKMPRMDKIERLASYFGISKSELIEAPYDYVSDPEGRIASIPEKKLKKLQLKYPNDLKRQWESYWDESSDELSLYFQLKDDRSLLDGPHRSFDNVLPLPKFKKVPLIGAIACGEPILAVENIDSYINMAEDINADFALKCKGDSMINARIFDGDYVYIRTQEDVDDGEIAAVLIGDEATLKRVHKYPGKLVLSSCNPMYNDLIYQNEQLNDIRILGKAVAFLSAIR